MNESESKVLEAAALLYNAIPGYLAGVESKQHMGHLLIDLIDALDDIEYTRSGTPIYDIIGRQRPGAAQEGHPAHRAGIRADPSAKATSCATLPTNATPPTSPTRWASRPPRPRRTSIPSSRSWESTPPTSSAPCSNNTRRIPKRRRKRNRAARGRNLGDVCPTDTSRLAFISSRVRLLRQRTTSKAKSGRPASCGAPARFRRRRGAASRGRRRGRGRPYAPTSSAALAAAAPASGV